MVDTTIVTDVVTDTGSETELQTADPLKRAMAVFSVVGPSAAPRKCDYTCRYAVDGKSCGQPCIYTGPHIRHRCEAHKNSA